ncbi:OmpP1/FadL family transporter [Polyangium aurulentum]|uniref:OmpP1/FadL family transporter n=1 Tax=Polyangium aurulentum TaxID=2567896 RepID=UPI001F1BA76C|nr:outer membrane protein transport protein [Polyangium aurulentum]
MRRSKLPRALFAFPALATLVAAPRGARGSGLDAPIVGSGQSGPTTADAAAIHWNPGALTAIGQGELFGGAGLIVGRAGYQRNRLGTYQTPDTLRYRTPLSPEYVGPSKQGWAEPVGATPIAPTGDLFFSAPVLDNRMALGLGVYVPYAAALDFPANGAQQWQLRQAFIAATFVTGSVAVRVLPSLSLGAGVSYVGGVASLSKVQDFASLPEFNEAFNTFNQPNDFGPRAPTEVRELDVLSRPMSITNAVSHGVSFNAGLMYEPTRDLRLGLAYQHSAAMRYRGRFALDMNDPFFTQDLAAQGLRYKPLVEGDAEIAFTLPKRITAGAGYQATEQFRIDGFVSYVFYSDVDAFDVTTSSPDLAQPKLGIGEMVKVKLPRDWNDTVWVEARGRHAFGRALAVSATIGYQSPASPDETIDVSALDGHRLIGGVGAAVQATRWLSLHGDARVQGIMPRTVTTSAQDLGNGRYTLFVAYAGGHAKARF